MEDNYEFRAVIRDGRLCVLNHDVEKFDKSAEKDFNAKMAMDIVYGRGPVQVDHRAPWSVHEIRSTDVDIAVRIRRDSYDDFMRAIAHVPHIPDINVYFKTALDLFSAIGVETIEWFRENRGNCEDMLDAIAAVLKRHVSSCEYEKFLEERFDGSDPDARKRGEKKHAKNGQT